MFFQRFVVAHSILKIEDYENPVSIRSKKKMPLIYKPVLFSLLAFPDISTECMFPTSYGDVYHQHKAI